MTEKIEHLEHDLESKDKVLSCVLIAYGRCKNLLQFLTWYCLCTAISWASRALQFSTVIERRTK